MKKKIAIFVIGGWMGAVLNSLFSMWHKTTTGSFVSTGDMIVIIGFFVLLVFFGWQLKDLFKD